MSAGLAGVYSRLPQDARKSKRKVITCFIYRLLVGNGIILTDTFDEVMKGAQFPDICHSPVVGTLNFLSIILVLNLR